MYEQDENEQELEDQEFDDEEDIEAEEADDEEDEEGQKHTGWKLPITGGTFITAELLSLMVHGGLLGAGAGLLGSAFVYLKGQQVIDAGLELFPSAGHVRLPAIAHKSGGKGRSFKDRLLGNFPEEPDQEGDKRQETRAEDDIFQLEQAEQPLPCARLKMKDIIAHIPPNSYRVYLGRSVLIDGYPARSVNIQAQHLKLIGASQKGKSSMAACILQQIVKTHDLDHALIAILDLEDRTGKLFANDPHLVTFRMSGQDVKMHARSKEQVLEYLGYIVQLMDYRYTLPTSEVEAMPLLVVYIEEFYALKDYFKRRISWEADQAQAKKDYDALIYRISELARRGLKARIQLLICAQVDYRDEDLCEAMANITAGMSFCVKPTAATAAGFTDTEKLNKNYKENLVGQAVAEFSGCKDMVLAPDYDLKKKLLNLERRQGRANDQGTPGTPLERQRSRDFQPRPDDRLRTSSEQEMEDIPANVRSFPGMDGTPLAEQPDATSGKRPGELRFSEDEIPLFLVAYRATRNIDKACQAMHKSAPRYRAHAREILAAHNERRA